MSKKTVGNNLVDTGYSWLVLLGSLCTQAIAMGTTFNVGIFVVEWKESLDTSSQTIAWIAGTNTSIVFGFSPLPCYLAEKFTHRKIIIVSGIVCTAGYIITALSSDVITIFFTYGILAGCGSCGAYSPSAIAVAFYFKRRRAMALTLASLGMGIGVMILAPIYTILIDYDGWRGAMLLSGGLSLHYCVFGALFIPIKDHVSQETQLQSLKERCKDYKIQLMSGSHFMWSLGYTLFYVYIPDFNNLNNLSKDQTAWMLTTVGVVGIASRLFFTVGFTVFRQIRALYLFAVSSMLAGISMSLIPVFPSVMAITIFSCLTVVGIAGISVTLGLATVQEFGLESSTIVFGFFMMMCGAGCLGGPPIAAQLLEQTGSYSGTFLFGGSSFLVAGVISGLIIGIQCIQRRQFTT